jgi:hypothetical protein
MRSGASVAGALIGLSAASFAFAQVGAPQPLGQFSDWGAYVASQNGQKLCFALSMRGGQSHVMIAVRPSDNVAAEVSIQVNYSFAAGAEATAQLGTESFALYTKDRGAWIKDVSEEGRVIAAMRREPMLAVNGTSTRGARTVERHSLNGLGPALDRATQECSGRAPTLAPPPQLSPPTPQPIQPAPMPQPQSPACERFPNLC